MRSEDWRGVRFDNLTCASLNTHKPSFLHVLISHSNIEEKGYHQNLNWWNKIQKIKSSFIRIVVRVLKREKHMKGYLGNYVWVSAWVINDWTTQQWIHGVCLFDQRWRSRKQRARWQQHPQGFVFREEQREGLLHLLLPHKFSICHDNAKQLEESIHQSKLRECWKCVKSNLSSKLFERNDNLFCVFIVRNDWPTLFIVVGIGTLRECDDSMTSSNNSIIGSCCHIYPRKTRLRDSFNLNECTTQNTSQWSKHWWHNSSVCGECIKYLEWRKIISKWFYCKPKYQNVSSVIKNEKKDQENEAVVRGNSIRHCVCVCGDCEEGIVPSLRLQAKSSRSHVSWLPPMILPLRSSSSQYS